MLIFLFFFLLFARWGIKNVELKWNYMVAKKDDKPNDTNYYKIRSLNKTNEMNENETNVWQLAKKNTQVLHFGYS